MQTAPSCQFSPCMKNSRPQKNAPAHANPAMCTFLRGDTVHHRPDDRQEERAEDRGEAGQVERQGPGGEVQSEARLTVSAQSFSRSIVGAAGRLAGDLDHVGPEEHRQDGRVERGVGPVVPVPGLLLLGVLERPEIRDPCWISGRHADSLQLPRSVSTSFNTSVRSVKIPSTPRSRSTRISSGSSTVHTWTGRPAACARRTSPRDAMVSPPPAVRDLQGRHLAAGQQVGEPAARQEPEQHDLDGRGGGGHPAVGEPPERVEPLAAERAHQDPVPGVAFGHEVRERGDRPVRLQVDVEAGLGELVEELGEGRHLLAATDQRAAYLLEGQVRDRALLVGDPVQDAVVERQQHPVGGDVDVGLQVVVAERDRVLESGEGVLQALDLGVVGTAPVREREHASRRGPSTSRTSVASPVRTLAQYVPGAGPWRGATAALASGHGSAVLPRLRRRDGHAAARGRRGQQLPRRPRRVPAPRRPGQPGRVRVRLAPPRRPAHPADAADHRRHDAPPVGKPPARAWVETLFG